jgi:hypothetical protein
MKPYHSIETIYKRDKATNLLHFGEIRMPEIAAVREWTFSEKIDGTNIRAIVTLAGIEVRGRSDNAQLHPDLIKAVLANFNHGRVVEYFTTYRGKELAPEWSVTFYGEGYGAGIQKGGAYSDTKRFRCFDVMLGDSWWLDDSEMRRICADLSVPVVPALGLNAYLPITREHLEYLLPNGSVVAFEDRGVTGVQAEGVVAKPTVVLFDKHGNRVMWKLTFREFKATASAA